MPIFRCSHCAHVRFTVEFCPDYVFLVCLSCRRPVDIPLISLLSPEQARRLSSEDVELSEVRQQDL